jgi:Domain of unknown function (4846)
MKNSIFLIALFLFAIFGGTLLFFPESLSGSQSLQSHDSGKTEIVIPENLPSYAWTDRYDIHNALMNRIATPAGFERIKVEAGSFSEWLRFLPLKPGKSKVMLYDGRRKWGQGNHVAVIDIDVGDKNLQQCADAVIRLRAEYLYQSGNNEGIGFHYTSGDLIRFADWAKGIRPKVSGNKVTMVNTGRTGEDYQNFKAYLQNLFMYAGTISLANEMKKSMDVSTIIPGDVFVQSGSPGHAMIVVDVAVNPETNERVFLLAQSYMPAQSIHIVVNPGDLGLSPWYSIEFGKRLNTPSWEFNDTDLHRF